MVKSLTKLALSASIMLALAFTFGCSGGDDGGGSGGGGGGNSNSSGQSKAVYGAPVTYEGETYKTVVIGEQTWMARNLNYAVDGSLCYDKPDNYCAIYGRLYDWATVMDIDKKYNEEAFGSDVNHKGICPPDWHIPSDDEWRALGNFIGSFSGAANDLKATSGWAKGDKSQDTYGFAALPGGLVTGFPIDEIGFWWTTTEESAHYAFHWQMRSQSGLLDSKRSGKDSFHTVRCIKD